MAFLAKESSLGSRVLGKGRAVLHPEPWMRVVGERRGLPAAGPTVPPARQAPGFRHAQVLTDLPDPYLTASECRLCLYLQAFPNTSRNYHRSGREWTGLLQLHFCAPLV